MPTIEYGSYTVLSRPRFDEKLRIWRPYASVSWQDYKFPFHQMTNLEKTFQTEDEALAFGYLAGRTWIDAYAGKVK